MWPMVGMMQVVIWVIGQVVMQVMANDRWFACLFTTHCLCSLVPTKQWAVTSWPRGWGPLSHKSSLSVSQQFIWDFSLLIFILVMYIWQMRFQQSWGYVLAASHITERLESLVKGFSNWIQKTSILTVVDIWKTRWK